MKSLAVITISGALCASAIAQDAAAPSSATQPATAPTTQASKVTDPEAYLDRLVRAKPGMAKPLQPVPLSEAKLEQPKAPRKTALPPDPNKPLKKDGYVVVDRIGRMEKTPDGRAWQYTFETSADMVDPPMVLLPSSKLAAMEDAQERAGASVRFRVSGLITLYEGQNYLLVDVAREWPWIDPSTQPAEPTTSPASEIATTQPSTQATTEPTTEPTTLPALQAIDPEQALSQLLRPRPRMARPVEVPLREVTTAPVVEGVAPGVGEVPLKREGEMVAQRIGRLEPGRQGDWSRFVFEADDRGMADPPMLIIPNERLAQMISAKERAGIDLRFSVTGLITTYKGRNYLLLEKAQLVTDHEGL